MKKLLFYSILLCFLNSCSDRGYEIRTTALNVSFSADGKIKSLVLNDKKMKRPMVAFSTVAGCRQDGATIVQKMDDGTICFERTLIHDTFQKSCVLIDRFIPTPTGVRWELNVKGTGESWGSAIQTRIKYPA